MFCLFSEYFSDCRPVSGSGSLVSNLHSIKFAAQLQRVYGSLEQQDKPILLHLAGLEYDVDEITEEATLTESDDGVPDVLPVAVTTMAAEDISRIFAFIMQQICERSDKRSGTADI